MGIVCSIPASQLVPVQEFVKTLKELSRHRFMLKVSRIRLYIITQPGINAHHLKIDFGLLRSNWTAQRTVRPSASRDQASDVDSRRRRNGKWISHSRKTHATLQQQCTMMVRSLSDCGAPLRLEETPSLARGGPTGRGTACPNINY